MIACARRNFTGSGTWLFTCSPVILPVMYRHELASYLQAGFASIDNARYHLSVLTTHVWLNAWKKGDLSHGKSLHVCACWSRDAKMKMFSLELNGDNLLSGLDGLIGRSSAWLLWKGSHSKFRGTYLKTMLVYFVILVVSVMLMTAWLMGRTLTRTLENYEDLVKPWGHLPVNRRKDIWLPCTKKLYEMRPLSWPIIFWGPG